MINWNQRNKGEYCIARNSPHVCDIIGYSRLSACFEYQIMLWSIELHALCLLQKCIWWYFKHLHVQCTCTSFCIFLLMLSVSCISIDIKNRHMFIGNHSVATLDRSLTVRQLNCVFNINLRICPHSGQTESTITLVTDCFCQILHNI